MKQIGRELGVSVATVSRALSNGPEVNWETRERVLQCAKELSYQPNSLARALVTGRTNVIGLIVPDLVHPFFAQVALGISAELRPQDYGLIISSSEEDPRLESREIEQMAARRVDALILASTQASVERFRTVGNHRLSFVLLDRRVSGLAADFVGIDDVMAGSLGTNHLLDIGCRTVAHIAGSDVSTAFDRQAGYCTALAAHNVSLSPAYIVKCNHCDHSGDAAGYDAMRTLLRLDPRSDGVFCCNDNIAMGAMRAILETGLRIPEDIAVVGCGNVHYADCLRVPLTSIDQDSHGLGQIAGRMALSMVKRRNKSAPRSILVPARLVIRASSRR
jgi:LacI family transcriptional regulator